MATAFKCCECRADMSMEDADYKEIAKHRTVVYARDRSGMEERIKKGEKREKREARGN